MNLRLSAALGPYDHGRDLRPQGIELLLLELSIEEIFFRFTKFREWQVSEMSFGKVISLMRFSIAARSSGVKGRLYEKS